jgi:hypothetical protein
MKEKSYYFTTAWALILFFVGLGMCAVGDSFEGLVLVTLSQVIGLLIDVCLTLQKRGRGGT